MTPNTQPANKRFRRDQESLRRVFDHTGDAIFVHCLDGRFTDVNHAACEALGYSRAEFLQMWIWDIVVGVAKRSLLDLWANMQSGIPIAATDELRRRDGTSFPAEIRLVRYRAPEQDIFIAICRDITKRRAAEAARVKAEVAMFEERHRMSREIHDTLAQSFTGILLQLEAAEAAMESGSPVDSYICRVRDLAKFGLAEARRSVLAMRPESLEKDGLVDALRQLAERSSVEGATDCAFATSGTLQRLDAAVELGVFRIAQEAVGNAVKHARAKRVSIELLFSAHIMRLRVIDDGCGIRSSAEPARKGYGLATMRERAREIGAKIFLATAPGGGTKISLSYRHPKFPQT